MHTVSKSRIEKHRVQSAPPRGECSAWVDQRWSLDEQVWMEFELSANHRAAP